MKTPAYAPFTIYDLRFTRRNDRRPPRLGSSEIGATAVESGRPIPRTRTANRGQQPAAADLVDLVLARALVLGWPASTLQRFNASTLAI